MTTDVQGRSHVPAGVRTGGQYATAARAEAGVDLAAVALCDQSPMAIDERLAELLNERFELQEERRRAMDSMHYGVGDNLVGPRRERWAMTNDEALKATRAKLRDISSFYGRESLTRSLDRWDGASARLGEVDALQRPLEDEYTRRGGWSRAFLVVGGDGHVHSSTGCSTCNKGASATRFQWMTDYSGATEELIVAAAGWRACTVCYVSAPVGDARTLPTAMFSEEEKQQAADRQVRAARAEQARADRIAKGLTPDGSPLRVSWVRKNAGGWDPAPQGGRGERVYTYRDRSDHEDFKTERSAVTWYVNAKVWARAGVERTDYSGAFEAIEQAIATKRGVDVDQVRSELLAKVEAKARRER